MKATTKCFRMCGFSEKVDNENGMIILENDKDLCREISGVELTVCMGMDIQTKFLVCLSKIPSRSKLILRTQDK